ncbi:MAG: DNA primase, partial [Kiritimatiellae bacterium]|nr:DNA primase [Kiritimatiellia bacterium]
ERSLHIRAARAEEALLAYLMRNPDRAQAVRETLPPETFVTAFNRTLYERLTDYISHTVWNGGAVPLTVFSEQYSPDEMSRIAEMMAKNSSSSNNRDAERDYIRVIREESQKPSLQKLAESDDAAILASLAKLRNQKK